MDRVGIKRGQGIGLVAELGRGFRIWGMGRFRLETILRSIVQDGKPQSKDAWRMFIRRTERIKYT